MTTLEDRLRQDLPALADVLMEDQTSLSEQASGPMVDGPGSVVELRPAHRRRRRSAAALAAAAAVAIVAGVALLATTADDNDIVIVESTAAPAAPSPDASGEAEGLASEGLATDPVLQWIEIDPPFEEVYGLQSVGDGRILARVRDDSGERAAVTTNGTDWAELPMPGGIRPGHIDISGDRWLVAEYDLDADAGDSRDSPKRVFFSDDRGATWNELLVEVPVAAGPAAPYVLERSTVMEALASGERIVIVVAVRTEFDMVSLLLDQGLISTEEWYSVLRWGDGAVTIEPTDPDDPGYERIEVSYETLGLTDDQQAVLEHPFGDARIWVFTSDSSSMELAAEYKGWGAVGAARADSFALLIEGPQDRYITSYDGRVWREVQMDPAFVYPPVPMGVDDDGAIWVAVRVAGAASYVKALHNDEDPATDAILGGLNLDWDLVGGPAGLAATARTTFIDVANLESLGADETRGTDTMEESFGPEATLVGWSPDGTEWQWQTMADAFGSRGGWAWAELAVGRDFVLARVGGSDRPPEITEVTHPQVGSLARSQATDTQPERWFIASVP